MEADKNENEKKRGAIEKKCKAVETRDATENSKVLEKNKANKKKFK